MAYVYLVSLRCGRFDKRYDVSGLEDFEIDVFIKNLVYDKKKYFVVKDYGDKV